MPERRECPVCARRVVVRFGIIEKHPRAGQPAFERDVRHPRPIEWCDASNKRWEAGG
jgi:hypothetical protein